MTFRRCADVIFAVLDVSFAVNSCLNRAVFTFILVKGHARSLKVVLFESLDTVSYSPSISEIKRDIVENRIFHTLLHSTPPLGVPSEYCDTVRYGKTEMV